MFSYRREVNNQVSGWAAILLAFAALLAAGCTSDSADSISTGSNTTRTNASSIDTFDGIDELAQQTADFRKPGTITHHTFTGPLPVVDSLDYIVYTPSSYNPQKPAPLMLAIHGCGTTAEQFMASSAIHPTAEREGFIVVYPDNPVLNAGSCWQWFSPASQVRDSGNPALLAGVTREVISRMNVDEDRVYALGMSSGAMMTSILGATYPDLFAAIAENAGCAYMAGAQCLVLGATMPDDLLGQLAFLAMGEFARVMPVVQIRGDLDGVHKSNSIQVIKQWTATNNMVMSGNTSEPFDSRSDMVFKGVKKDGYAYTVNRFLDDNGCLLIEDWNVHNMYHAFSGGSPGEENFQFADPRGPMFAEIAWKFFSRYRLSDFTNGYKPSQAACTVNSPRSTGDVKGIDADDPADDSGSTIGATLAPVPNGIATATGHTYESVSPE